MSGLYSFDSFMDETNEFTFCIRSTAFFEPQQKFFVFFDQTPFSYRIGLGY